MTQWRKNKGRDLTGFYSDGVTISMVSVFHGEDGTVAALYFASTDAVIRHVAEAKGYDVTETHCMIGLQDTVIFTKYILHPNI